MPKTKRPYAPEYRKQLVRSGRKPEDLEKEFAAREPGKNRRARPVPWLLAVPTARRQLLLACAMLTWLGLARPGAGSEIRFQHLTGEHGLAQSRVIAVLQDSRGFLWFATWGGLNRYDGYTMYSYDHNPDDPTSISSDTATSIIEDSSGAFWIGTGAGLNRYDPLTETFTRFRAGDDPQSLTSDLILYLHQDSHETIWVVTMAGYTTGVFHTFDPETGAFTRYLHDPDDPTSVSGNGLCPLYEDPGGTIWIAPAGAGLDRFNPESRTFTHYRHDPEDRLSLNDDRVTCVHGSDHKFLWVGTEGGGLNRLDLASDTFTSYRHDPDDPASLSCDHVTHIFEDRSGALWIATWGGGLCRFDRSSGQFTRYLHRPDDPYSLSSNFVPGPLTSLACEALNPLVEDQEGRLWVITVLDRDTPNGIDRFDPQSQRFTHCRHRPGDPRSLGSDHLLGTYQDRSGTIWLSTKDHGLSMFSPTRAKFSSFSHHPDDPHSLVANSVWSILEDSSGTVWIGTESGLDRFDGRSGRFSHLPGDRNRPLLGNSVRSVMQDRSGRIWAGTNGGLNLLDSDSGEVLARYPVTNVDHQPSYVTDAPTPFEDRSGRLWLASRTHGLSLFDPTTQQVLKRYRNDPDNPASLSSSLVVTLAEAPSGELWIATLEGLNRLDPSTEQITRYLHDPEDPQTLSGDYVMSLHFDPEGILWSGTAAGLNRLDPATGKFSHFTEQDGLANDSVYGIVSDEAGNLWLSTDQGLSRFNPATARFRNYDVSNGLASNEFAEGAYHRGPSGTLYFGGIGGLTLFDPRAIRDNPHPPPVVLTKVEIFEKPLECATAISEVDHIELSYHQNFISFEFAALDYGNPAKNRYAYKLEGFDDDWHHCGNRRFVSFTPGPGRYRFLVKAANSDGVWNQQGLAVSLTITAKPWQQWWAYCLYLLGLAVTILGLVRIQARRLNREQEINRRLRQADKLKDEFLANTSHELRTPLNGIIGIAESLIDGATGELAPSTRSNLRMIAHSGRRLANLVNDILDFAQLEGQQLTLTSRPIDLHTLVEVVLTLCQPLGAGKNLELENSVDPELRPVSGDEALLEQILINLVGNAIKFTPAGAVTVTATPLPDQPGLLAVTVADSGIGISDDQRDHIFEPFSQADSSTAREYGGSGLGLAVTRQLVVLHGGTIGVESDLGRGSRFTFTLPLSRGGEVAEVAAPAGDCEISRLRPGASMPAAMPDPIPDQGVAEVGFAVLIVDDEPVNLEVLHNYLSLANFGVTRCDNGPEALAAVAAAAKAERPFDLVVLDIMMPRMTGYEVCRRLRDTYSLYELPILMLTAKNQVGDLVAGFSAGANDYLAKPFAKRELLARARTLMMLKQQTAANAVLKQANELKNDLLRMAAHDLRTPLGAIVGFAQVINRDEGGASSAWMATRITSAAQQMLQLIDELIESARIESGRLVLNREPLDLAALAAEVISSHAEAAKRKDQTVIFAGSDRDQAPDPGLPGSPGTVVSGDHGRLTQIIDNLLSNAIKYSPRGGAIRVEVQRLAGGAEGVVRLAVSDQGPGIAEEYRSQLFGKFQRLAARPTGGETSTGLGLAIAKQLVELHRGRIWAEQGSGEGAVFVVELPAATMSE